VRDAWDISGNRFRAEDGSVSNGLLIAVADAVRSLSNGLFMYNLGRWNASAGNVDTDARHGSE
jgi:hypothetical protein